MEEVEEEMRARIWVFCVLVLGFFVFVFLRVGGGGGGWGYFFSLQSSWFFFSRQLKIAAPATILGIVHENNSLHY